MTSSWDGTVRLWDFVTYKPLAALTGYQTQQRAVAWSPDGSKLATAGTDRAVHMWEAATGNELLSMQGHTATINTLAS